MWSYLQINLRAFPLFQFSERTCIFLGVCPIPLKIQVCPHKAVIFCDLLISACSVMMKTPIIYNILFVSLNGGFANYIYLKESDFIPLIYSNLFRSALSWTPPLIFLILFLLLTWVYLSFLQQYLKVSVKVMVFSVLNMCLKIWDIVQWHKLASTRS